MDFSLTSPAFDNNGDIPAKYTCEGPDVSPPLVWDNVPDGTRSLVLIVDDPDAPNPSAPKMTWVHWVLFNIPPTAGGLDEDAGLGGLPEGTRVGVNDWGRTSYGGPCPPIGRHRYFHKLYALDIELSNLNAPSKGEVGAAMQGHILAMTDLVGTYQKQG